MKTILRAFASDLLQGLHAVHSAEYFFHIQAVVVDGHWTAVFVKRDDVHDDRIDVDTSFSKEAFIHRMQDLKPTDVDFDYDQWQELAHNECPILGYTKRQIYMIRGGFSPELWTRNKAYEQLMYVLSAMTSYLPPALLQEWQDLNQRMTWMQFEDLVRRTVNCLFTPELGEAVFQSRTEQEAEGTQERRDLLCSNKANIGFWKDLKDKFATSEILFEAKFKAVLTRDDLRQAYCYLKPSLGYWGCVVFSGEADERILGYNRTLFRNFQGNRGVLILNRNDILRMLQVKTRGHDPTDYLHKLYSKFNQEA